MGSMLKIQFPEVIWNIPTLLSFSRVVLIPIFIYFLSKKTFEGCLIALVIFLIASLTDILDGWSARRLRQESEFGAFIDPFADKCLVISAIVAIIVLDPQFEFFDTWMIFIIVSRDVLLTYMRMLAIKKGKQLRTSRLGKVKTAFQMISIVIIIMIYLAKKGNLFTSHESLPYWIMLFVTIFTAISGVRYVVTNWQLFVPSKSGVVQKIWVKEFLFSGFFSGYFPVAPGTAGTVMGLLLYVVEYTVFGSGLHWGVNLALVAFLFYPSVCICRWGEVFFNEKDPGPVVWDEIVGYFVTMLFLPFNWKIAIAGFFVFRVMDIWKPFPVHQLQNFNGGLGILIDDVAAGIYSCAFLHAALYLVKLGGFKIL